MIKNIGIFLLFVLICSCSKRKSILDQRILNEIVTETLKYLVLNDCFEYRSFNTDSLENIISVSKDLVLEISKKDSLNDLYISKFIKDPNANLTKFDTINIKSWDNKKILMSSWSNIVIGWDFQKKLSQKLNGEKLNSTICSYVFSKPYIVELNGGNQILIKVMRYLDAPIEFCYFLIETNKNFDIANIECYKEKKNDIPEPPSEILKNNIQIIPKM